LETGRLDVDVLVNVVALPSHTPFKAKFAVGLGKKDTVCVVELVVPKESTVCVILKLPVVW
jgi:hypothetical protein